ncbi:MAG: glycoside hydrolase N-terminal domain-containing protein [Oscillospiraceae bacterium]
MSAIPQKCCNISIPKTITRWDEALPLGNGLCGALIWGGARGLRFSMDRGDIWDTTPFPGVKSPLFNYATMVRLAKSGDVEGIRDVFDAPYNHTLPSKLPAGKLIFDFGCDNNVSSYLDLSTACAEISIDDIKISSFLHATQKCGFIHINKPLSSFNYKIENPEYSIKGSAASDDKIADSGNTSSLKALFYQEPKLVHNGTSCYFTQQISESFSYGLFVKAVEISGETTLCFYVATSNDGASWVEDSLALLDDALHTGYSKAFAFHAEWWSKYWAESSVSLPDVLFEKNWYITNYLLASCSRRGCYPMPLQGVWTADDGALPPWKGDYHHDLNTQMSYYSYLKANHISEGESFIDYLWSMVGCARSFAKSFYDAKGICMPSTMSLDGAPLGGWGMYSLSPTNQLWLCQAFERHYRFTGDKAFLREKAYPYLSQTAEFILSILEEKDGFLYLPISSSPEIHDDLIESFVTPNSNYDLSMMRYLFTALIKLSKEINSSDEAKWQAVLSKLPPLSIAENGVLMVSPDESLNESHRHFSHAMAIHPLRLLPYTCEENRRIIDATILDLERLGSGYWVGFSFTWMAEMYAVQKNGNGAAYQLEVFWRNFCSQNGFHLNGDYKKRGSSTFHYRPFTLEANMCAADALQEMLLQTEDSSLEFFPAIPDEWREKELSFENLRAENGLLVSAAMQKGIVTSITLKPQYSCTVTIKNFAALQSLEWNLPFETIDNGASALISLIGGKEYHLEHI